MSTLVLCGLNHHTSPVDVREKIAMPKQCLSPALRSLVSHPHIAEAVILSTCNRTEVYAICSSTGQGLTALHEFFAAASAHHGREIAPTINLSSDEAALHLFRVAGGLDSVVVGESQILGQVRQALQTAQEVRSAGPLLNKLFNIAIACGKQVRTETGICRKAVSVASAAVELAQLHSSMNSSTKVLIVGAGRMGTLCAKHLIGKRAGPVVTVLNQSQPRLDELKQCLPDAAVTTSTEMKDLSKLYADSEIIFVATSSPDFVLTSTQLPAANQRKLIFDLGLPRNVDPRLASQDGVRLFSVDDLRTVVQENLQQRQSMVMQAMPYLHKHLEQYHRWLSQRRALASSSIPMQSSRLDARDAMVEHSAGRSTTKHRISRTHYRAQH